MKTFKLKLAHYIGLSLVVILTGGTPARAQDFTPDLGDLLNKQATLLGTTAASAPMKNYFWIQKEQPQQPQPEWMNWTVATWTSQYGFGYTHSYLNDSITKKNGGAFSLLILAPYQFTLLPTLAVGASGVETLAGSDTAQSLSINPSLQIGHDVFSSLTTNFLGGTVTLLGKIGYTAADSSSLVGVKPSFSQMDGWAYGGGIKYTIKPTRDLLISLTPNYSYNQNETVNVPVGTTTMTHQGT